MAAADRTEGGIVSLSLDRSEMRRMREAVTAAEGLLGREPTAATPDLETLAELIAALEAELADGETGAEAKAAVAHEQQLERLRSRFRRRREAFSRLDSGVASLREMTSPAAIFDAAPRLLTQSSSFERTLLSSVNEGRMVIVATHFENDPDAAAAVRERLVEQSIALEHPLLEAEVLRRRRATAVAEASVNPRVSPILTAAMGWSSYVAAPVVIQGRVIAVLHADRGDGSLDVLDRDLLWRFAVGLGQVYESASLRRRLRRERDYMRRFLDRLDARLGELSDSPIEFAPGSLTAGTPANLLPRDTDGARTFDGVLTRRELEILALLAEGMSNRELADRLVISEGTVKFHVNSILRKLRAQNRAEAVSRYLTQTAPPRA